MCDKVSFEVLSLIYFFPILNIKPLIFSLMHRKLSSLNHISAGEQSSKVYHDRKSVPTKKRQVSMIRKCHIPTHGIV